MLSYRLTALARARYAKSRKVNHRGPSEQRVRAYECTSVSTVHTRSMLPSRLGRIRTTLAMRGTTKAMLYARHRYISSGKKFYDRVYVQVQGGRGGFGCVSVDETGRPDGGNGGRGGSVIVRATSNLRHLTLPKRHYKGNVGGNGSRNAQHGKNAEDIVITVPTGTIVKRSERVDALGEDEREEGESTNDFVIVDLDEDSDEFVLCRGGLGGRGNRGNHGNRRRKKVAVPPPEADPDENVAADPDENENDGEIEHHTPGTEGEHMYLEFELKTIADVGLVGFPNAGKSTMLRALSRATPKVANYPFTTLEPTVGMIQYADGKQVSVADIPGIVDGAHANRGLGHDFLRHIERTEIILYLLDFSGDSDPTHDYLTLREELRLYSPDLLNRRALVVLNKVDSVVSGDYAELPTNLALERVVRRVDQFRKEVNTIDPDGEITPVIAASALLGTRIGDVAMALRSFVFAPSNTGE